MAELTSFFDVYIIAVEKNYQEYTEHMNYQEHVGKEVTS